MSNLIRKCGYLVAVAVLCFAGSAFANTEKLTFTGGTYSGIVGPYDFHVNSSTAITKLICDDYIDHIQANESWNVNVLNVAQLDATATGTYFGSAVGLDDYKAAAWLAQQMFKPGYTDVTDRTNINYAIWAIFDDTLLTGLNSAQKVWYYQAEGGTYKAITYTGHEGDPLSNFANVFIYTWDGNKSTIKNQYDSSRPQEFIGVPEARTSALLGAGLVGLVALML